MNFSRLAEETKWRSSDSDTSQERTSHTWQTPLTGRDTELSLLRDRWEQAQEGMGQVVLVIGEAGLGKSRLVRTLAESVWPANDSLGTGERAADKSPILIEWRCSEHFRNSELYPVTDYLERSIDRGRDEDTADRFERLARHLEDYGVGRPEVVALFAKLLLLPADERYPQFALTPAREREETFWCTTRVGARAISSSLGALHRRRSTLDRRLYFGIPQPFYQRRSARSNSHRLDVSSRIQNSLACLGTSDQSGAESADTKASSRLDAQRCR